MKSQVQTKIKERDEDWTRAADKMRDVPPVKTQTAAQIANELIIKLRCEMTSDKSKNLPMFERRSKFRRFQRMYHPDRAEDKNVGILVFQWLNK